MRDEKINKMGRVGVSGQQQKWRTKVRCGQSGEEASYVRREVV
jgi:hypothetical protein